MGKRQRRAVSCSAIAGLLALSGCINPSEKIATSLTRYGLDESQARGVGDRLEANLSIGQLQELGRVARAVNEGDATAGDLVRVSGQISDVRVPIEVAKATAGCGALSGAAAGA